MTRNVPYKTVYHRFGNVKQFSDGKYIHCKKIKMLKVEESAPMSITYILAIENRPSCCRVLISSVDKNKCRYSAF